jgi:hypothetical protein
MRPSYPLNRRLGGHQIRRGRFTEKNYLLPLRTIEPRFIDKLFIIFNMNVSFLDGPIPQVATSSLWKAPSSGTLTGVSLCTAKVSVQ